VFPSPASLLPSEHLGPHLLCCQPSRSVLLLPACTPPPLHPSQPWARCSGTGRRCSPPGSGGSARTHAWRGNKWRMVQERKQVENKCSSCSRWKARHLLRGHEVSWEAIMVVTGMHALAAPCSHSLRSHTPVLPVPCPRPHTPPCRHLAAKRTPAGRPTETQTRQEHQLLRPWHARSSAIASQPEVAVCHIHYCALAAFEPRAWAAASLAGNTYAGGV
jgi:hypothetical protein